MEGHNVKINYAKLTDAYAGVVNTPKGNKMCVVIPVEENNIFLSQKGGIYQDFTALKLYEPKYGQTHQLKAKVPFEKYKAMTKEERDRLPIVGGLQPLFPNNNENQQPQQAQPQQTTQRAETNKPIDANDLPF